MATVIQSQATLFDTFGILKPTSTLTSNSTPRTVAEEIFFHHPPAEIKKNPKYDDTMYDFELLSGRVCQKCGLVLDAYYIGTLPVNDTTNSYQYHPYVPKEHDGYRVSHPRYRYGHKYGGGYLILSNHNETLCETYISSVVGIIEGIKSFIIWIVPTPEIVPTDYMLKKFAAEVLEKKIPGMFLIEDVCPKRLPTLAVNKETFSKNINWTGHTEFDKEYKWNVALYKLIIGDPEVQIKLI